jgi:hypothetical protein
MCTTSSGRQAAGVRQAVAAGKDGFGCRCNAQSPLGELSRAAVGMSCRVSGSAHQCANREHAPIIWWRMGRARVGSYRNGRRFLQYRASHSMAVTAVTSYRSSTPLFFGRRSFTKNSTHWPSQIRRLIHHCADPRPSAVLSILSNRLFDRCLKWFSFWHRCQPRRRYFSEWRFWV